MSRNDELAEVVEAFLADGRLSRRKRAFLEQALDQIEDNLGAVASPDVAPGEICSGLDLDPGSYWCQVAAAVLDGQDHREGKPLAQCDRLRRLEIVLEECGHLNPDQVEA
jgi:hypothetical protein